MNDRITIDPTAVRSAGGAVDIEAGEATAALKALFDSAQPAEGISRIATALNGLGNDPLAGQ
ncbi:hypothetical protein G3I13_24105 [Streptomyces sp. SID6673]|nr:hypothetical protein [Streptomyces sp. SID11726]NEB27433.1 hypothetical protein [Streptomyces sp. SID6673]